MSVIDFHSAAGLDCDSCHARHSVLQGAKADNCEERFDVVTTGPFTVLIIDWCGDFSDIRDKVIYERCLRGEERPGLLNDREKLVDLV